MHLNRHAGASPSHTAEHRESTRPDRIRRVLIGITVAAGAALAWDHRWITDDAMIYVRAVRNILAGNGPVYNIHERVETSTGTLWQWLLAAVSWVTPLGPASAALYLGLLFFVAALVVGATASTRFAGTSAAVRWQLPLGLAVVVVLPPFRDFATSGLETSLTYFWIAASWLLLVRALHHRNGAQPWMTAVWLGLGPLIRPDMALVTAVFGLCLPGLRPLRAPLRAAVLGLSALALPVSYQVFRMGYYGEVVPMPAITKSATEAQWGKGLGYLADFGGTYWLLVPLVVAVVFYVGLLRDAWRTDLARVLVLAAPPVAAVLSAVYVVRVGGDFMHARMLLPATFLFLLPVFVVTVRRTTLVVAAALAAWVVVCAVWLRVDYEGGFEARGLIADERGVYINLLDAAHPDENDYDALFEQVATRLPSAPGSRTLAGWSLPAGTNLPLAKDKPNSIAVVDPLLGLLGAGIPLNGAAVDPLGLAYPLGAHMEGNPDGRPGHSKLLPPEWIIADYADPDADLPEGLDATRVEAARAALACPRAQELLEGSRSPLTMSRFIDNLTSALSRSRIVIPRDPIEAERVLCD